MGASTVTGGREATRAVVPGRYALSIGNPQKPLPNGWAWTRLTSLARLESGHTPSRRRPEYWDGDVPWIGIKDATTNHGRVIHDTFQHVSEMGIENSSARILPAGTVCLSRTASVGYVVVMGHPMSTSQDFVNWVCGDRLDWRFLKHVLLAETDALRRFAHGTTHQTIYFPEAKAFHIARPPLDEQHAVASVLAALAEKIDSNGRLCEFARATLMQAAPRHGSSVPLADTAAFLNGGALTKQANGAGRPILRIKELRAGVTADTPRTDAVVKPAHEVALGELLFSWSGTLLTCRWSGEPAVLNQHVFRVDPQPGYPRWLIEAWIEQHMARFRQIAADKATTMGHIQRHHLAEAEVLVPPPELCAELESQWTPLDRYRVGLLAESRNLTAIRDALLPKLVSGQIRVPPTRDEQEAVETVVAELEAEPVEC